jgi:hypothetical protein
MPIVILPEKMIVNGFAGKGQQLTRFLVRFFHSDFGTERNASQSLMLAGE